MEEAKLIQLHDVLSKLRPGGKKVSYTTRPCACVAIRMTSFHALGVSQ